ncbi:MAG: DNA polymerase Y family protein [Brachybacterium sp.]|nr:DNA polymerase Y family protein [Brachybacterium sp.]
MAAHPTLIAPALPGATDTRPADRATRVAAVVVPAWPLLAARDRLERQEETPSGPVILLDRHRVLHAEGPALATGVAVGMRRRAAQAACPGAVVVESDRELESALFELVSAAVDTAAAGVDVLRPGVLLMAARGPARHHGGEEQLAERTIDAVAELTGWDCQVGIADGPFAALIAARTGRIIRPGRSADYLAPHAITALREAPVGPGWGHRDQAPATRDRGRRLDLAEVIDLLQRLGIATLGDLAALPAAAVTDRFGPDVATLHLLARGLEATPPAAHHPTQPIEVVRALETPLVCTDQAAFVARPMAEELQEQLTRSGLICTRLRIIARTESGEEMERTWRHDGALSVADIVDRLRWQCDGWITAARLGRAATGAITRLGLHPVQTMPAGEGAPGLWGSAGEAAQRAERAFARAQGLAGEDAVLVPTDVGGRLLTEQVRLVPWRSEKPAARPGPWPGAVPRPVPATVFGDPPPVQLLDAQGRPVVVTARGLLSSAPVRVEVPAASREALQHTPLRAGGALQVTGHSAPTILDERWWAADGRRAARLQMLLEDPAGQGLAVLALSREGAWTLEGLYD